MWITNHMWAINLAFSILTMIFTLILTSKVLQEHRAPGSTLAWILVMFLIPFIGIPLYLIIGDRKIKKVIAKKDFLYPEPSNGSVLEKMTPIARLLHTAGMPDETLNNQFHILATGEEAFAAILRIIRGAKISIHISTFCMKNDDVGNAIMDALCEKARQGINVCLLLDGVGSFWFPRRLIKHLKKAGVKVAVFVPFLRVPFSGHSNLRNHRKLILVDYNEAILGGMNLTEQYMGSKPNLKRWADCSFLIGGKSIMDLEDMFKSDWQFASGEIINKFEEKNLTEISGETSIQVVASGPDVPRDPLYDVILTQIFSATRRIWIVTPYFIPDESLAQALELACKKGIDVRIIIPSHSDHRLADICRTSYLKQLDIAGAHLCFYDKSMLHAKMILIDNSFALIGSVNLDIRSLFLNYEVGILLSSLESITLINKWIDDILTRTREVHPKDNFSTRFIEGLGRILAPLF